MATSAELRAGDLNAASPLLQGKSAVSWPAIFAGAFVASGVSVILLTLGSGLGFAAVSPWADRGVSASAFAASAAIWLIVTQWIAAGLGGYIAGRLRSRWLGTHVHEVFFRDTAHGLIAWAVATVLVAASLTTSLSSVVGGGLHAASEVAAGGAQGAAPHAMTRGPDAMSRGPDGPAPAGAGYGVDKLFRTAVAGSPQNPGDVRMEAAHIAANAVATGNVPDADRAYLAELVVARTGIPQAEAQKRVDDFISGAMDAAAKIKAEADQARKTAAEASIYLALSLLVGAFIAGVSAALGGRQRDEHV